MGDAVKDNNETFSEVPVIMDPNPPNLILSMPWGKLSPQNS